MTRLTVRHAACPWCSSYALVHERTQADRCLANRHRCVNAINADDLRAQGYLLREHDGMYWLVPTATAGTDRQEEG